METEDGPTESRETHRTLITPAHSEASLTVLSELQPPDHCGFECQDAVGTQWVRELEQLARTLQNEPECGWQVLRDDVMAIPAIGFNAFDSDGDILTEDALHTQHWVPSELSILCYEPKTALKVHSIIISWHRVLLYFPGHSWIPGLSDPPPLAFQVAVSLNLANTILKQVKISNYPWES